MRYKKVRCKKAWTSLLKAKREKGFQLLTVILSTAILLLAIISFVNLYQTLLHSEAELKARQIEGVKKRNLEAIEAVKK